MGEGWERTRPWMAVAQLMAALAAFAIAPQLMPDSYSVIEHSVSESAAQGVVGAWLARLGFLLLGSGVLTCVRLAGERWGLGGRIAHRAYAVGLFGAAAFSHKPWLDVPFDEFEDVLHSASANLVGAGFTIGVILVSLRRGRGSTGTRVFDGLAVAVAMGFSLLMFNVDGVAGLVQRVMFVIGIAWYTNEAVRSRHPMHTPADAGGVA